MNRAPTANPRALNAAVARMSSSHTLVRAIDQAHISRSNVGRDKVGAAIGIVLRPSKRSPSMSLKSVAWFVVPYAPALINTDSIAISPSLWGFWPSDKKSLVSTFVVLIYR